MSGRDRINKLIWLNDFESFKEAIEEEPKEECARHDIRGNSPLILAIMLGRTQFIEPILLKGASCTSKSKLGWLPLHEARSLGNRDVIRMILKYRRLQMENYLRVRAQKTIEKLQDLDDFYLEMRWDFSSWIPFVSRFCPSDTYKMWKKGCNLRVDTTLKGFENLKWLRGEISFIYQAENGEYGSLYVLDHEQKKYEKLGDEPIEKIEERINFFMNTKIRTGQLQSELIVFNRSKSGPLGLGSSKTEMVGIYEADVFTVSNVNIRSLTRSEHLQNIKKDKINEVEKVEEFLEGDSDAKEEEILEKVKKFEIGKKDADIDKMITDARESVLKFRESLPPPAPPSISFEQYFFPELNIEAPKSKKSGLGIFGNKSSDSLSSSGSGEVQFLHVGRELVLHETNQNFKASVWMSNSFPLFVEQLLPLLEILAPSNKHFETLKEFIELKLPRGFPVKIEIPLFKVLTAKISFQNYVPSPEMEDSLFVIPKDYIEGEVKLQ